MGGCWLAVGSGGGTATIRSVVVGPLGRTLSAPQTVTVSSRSVRLSYTIQRPAEMRDRLSRWRARVIEVVADGNCSGVDLLVVVAGGAVMPLHAGQGEIVGRFSAMSMSGGESKRFTVEIPRGTRRPYWVRCFAEPSGVVTVVDPPVTTMKVARGHA